VLAGCAIAYTILARALAGEHDAASPLVRALGNDRKGKLSLALYLAAIPLAFVSSWIAGLIYIGVAIGWLVPDRRFEHALKKI
jgi:uncharacterized membrane protein